MLLLEGVALTPSGRPVLAPEELELRILEKTDVEFGPARGGLRESPAEKYTGGIAFLTSHRLIWLDAAVLPSPGRSCSLQLARAMVASAVPLKMFGSRTRRHRIACRRGVLAPDDPGGEMRLAFRGEAPDAFARTLDEALARRAWLADAEPRNSRPPPPPPRNTRGLAPSADQARAAAAASSAAARASASRAGVSGALLRQREDAAARDAALGEAFTDMTALMHMAKDMVRLAEHIAEKTSRRDRDRGGGDAAAGEVDAAMLSMGIASPVTRESAGALYHQQLSRQLGDWLAPVLDARGGILPLPEVFCLFNRARGAELISPEDLLKAASLFEKLGVPLRERVFPSGVRVVQSPARGDDEVCAALARVLGNADEGGGGKTRLDAFDASAALGIAPAVAGEFLRMAEGHGILCRDEGPEATWFYPNRFAAFTAC